jgi:threonine dehydratase
MSVLQTAKKVHPALLKVLNKTPVHTTRRLLGDRYDRVHLKLENSHFTGSFKERGVLAYFSLAELPRGSTVCAASAGNHALALSYHANRHGLSCVIIVPISAPAVKVKRAEAFGARVIIHGQTFDEAYAYAESYAVSHNLTFVPPFNHPSVIAGQGTIGLEIIQQVDDIDVVLVPVGGGGLISGIAAVLKSLKPTIKIIGVQTKYSYYGGDSIFLPPAPLADGIAVKHLGEHTIPFVQRYVDEMIVVDIEEVAESLINLLEFEHLLTEGAAAAAFAPLYNTALSTKFKRPLVVISGSNIDLDRLGNLIFRSYARRKKIVELEIAVPDQPGMLARITNEIATRGANIISIAHQRSFTAAPGMAELLCTLQVQNSDQGEQIAQSLEALGFSTRLTHHTH